MQQSDPTTAEVGTPSTVDGQQPKGRRIAFRVVATLVALWFLALNVFGLMELVVMWLPADSVAETFDEEVAFVTAHRSHFMAIGVISWALVISVLVQLRTPERRIAPMQLVVLAALGGTIVYGLSGTLGDWLFEEIAMVVVPVSALTLVHPGRDQLLTIPTFDRRLTALAGLAALPWLVFIVDNAWSQLTNAAGDPHAEMEHWGTAALMGIVILAAAALGSTDHRGSRLTGWIAAGASVLFGAHSLMFTDGASSLPAFWAVAAILWGVAYGVMLIHRSRTGVVPVTSSVAATAG